MNTLINLNTLIDQRKLTKNYLRPWQRYIAAFMGYFLILQICLPTVAIAATMLTSEQFSGLLNSPVYKSTGKTSGNFYARPNYLQVDTQSGSNIASFYKSLSPTKSVLPETTLVVGDDFVQQRLIRGQISMVLGRTLIDPSKLLLGSEAKKAYELTQNDSLFAAGVQFGLSKAKAFGAPLTAQDTVVNDMIWPEKRSIYGADVIIPVVYLSQATLNTKPVGHQINLGLSTIFNNMEVNKGLVVSAAGNENYTTVISAINNIVNSGSVSGAGNLNLVAGNTLANLSGKIQATNNLDISVVKGNVINKTQLIPYQSKDGSGSRFGTIATIDSLNGNIKITSGGNIAYEGGTSTSFYGSLTFNANGNIILAPATITSESTTQDGGWTVNKTSFELMQSKLTANQMLTLMAGGTITITASELYSTQGGIQLLAKHGIYVADELGYFQSNRTDKLGRTTGTGSDFESFAVRSVLSAGKGVLLATDSGDITLKGAKITAGEGTQVKATNGKVHLLVTKENSQHYLDTIKKGTWTIKTVHEEYLQDTGIPNAIVGGLAVEALAGVDIEYAGREGATLAQQIAEYDKMPDTKWMADIYYGNTKFKDANGNLVPLNTVVDFSQVELAYKHVREHNSSLSPAAMAIIAICVAIAMGPAGAGLIGSGGLGGATVTVGGITTTSISLSGAIAQAAMLTLATSAAQNLAAGKNLEDTLKAMTNDDALKNLAISMATAGALNGLDVGNMELFDDAPIGSALDFANQSYQAVVYSVVTAGISVTINGGNSEDYRKAFTQSLATNAVNTIGQSLTNKITNSTTLNEASKYIAHAAMGCLTAGLTNKLSDADFKDACPSGAGGAVIAQGVADLIKNEIEVYNSKVTNTPVPFLAEEYAGKLSYWGKNGVDISKLLAGFAALAFGGDVNAAANTASSVASTYKDQYAFAFSLGSALQQFKMVDCGSVDLITCSASKTKANLRSNILSASNLSPQQVDESLAQLDEKGFFTVNAKLNLALIQKPGDAMNLLGIKNNTNFSYAGQETEQEVVVDGHHYTVYQEFVQDYHVVLGHISEGADTVAQKAVITLAFTMPEFKSALQIFSFVDSNAQEQLHKSENYNELMAKGSSEIELRGATAVGYLNGRTIEDSLDAVKSHPLGFESLEYKGVLFLAGTVVSWGAGKAIDKTVGALRNIKPGKEALNGGKGTLVKETNRIDNIENAAVLAEREAAENLEEGLLTNGIVSESGKKFWAQHETNVTKYLEGNVGASKVGTQISVDITIKDAAGNVTKTRCIIDNLVANADGSFTIVDAKSSINKDLSLLTASDLAKSATTKNQKAFYDALANGNVAQVMPVGDRAVTYFNKLYQNTNGIPTNGIQIQKSIDFYVNDTAINGYKIFKKTLDL